MKENWENERNDSFVAWWSICGKKGIILFVVKNECVNLRGKEKCKKMGYFTENAFVSLQ